jgi:hypothetical protein
MVVNALDDVSGGMGGKLFRDLFVKSPGGHQVKVRHSHVAHGPGRSADVFGISRLMKHHGNIF